MDNINKMTLLAYVAGHRTLSFHHKYIYDNSADGSGIQKYQSERGWRMRLFSSNKRGLKVTVAFNDAKNTETTMVKRQ